MRNEKYGREGTEAEKGVKQTSVHLCNRIGLINSMEHPLNGSYGPLSKRGPEAIPRG